MLVSNNESKGILKKYKKLWDKIRNTIKLLTHNSDSYDEKYMKMKFNTDDNLSLKKTL